MCILLLPTSFGQTTTTRTSATADNQNAITHNIKANLKRIISWEQSEIRTNEMKSLPHTLTAHWHYCRGSLNVAQSQAQAQS